MCVLRTFDIQGLLVKQIADDNKKEKSRHRKNWAALGAYIRHTFRFQTQSWHSSNRENSYSLTMSNPFRQFLRLRYDSMEERTFRSKFDGSFNAALSGWSNQEEVILLSSRPPVVEQTLPIRIAKKRDCPNQNNHVTRSLGDSDGLCGVTDIPEIRVNSSVRPGYCTWLRRHYMMTTSLVANGRGLLALFLGTLHRYSTPYFTLVRNRVDTCVVDCKWA